MIAARPGRHFTWGEFTRSTSATAKGISNLPDDAQQRAIISLCAAILDPLRIALGKPVRITSGFRSAALNAAIDGSKSSQHMVGEAADIKVDGLTAPELARHIVDLGLPFDQVIWYAPNNGGQVHVSHTTRRPNRGQRLSSPTKGRYEPW